MTINHLIHRNPDSKMHFRLVQVIETYPESKGGVAQMEFNILEDMLTFDQAAAKIESLRQF